MYYFILCKFLTDFPALSSHTFDTTLKAIFLKAKIDYRTSFSKILAMLFMAFRMKALASQQL